MSATGPAPIIDRRSFFALFNPVRKGLTPVRAPKPEVSLGPSMGRREFSKVTLIFLACLKVVGLGGAVSTVENCGGAVSVSDVFNQQKVRSHKLPGSLYDPLKQTQGDATIGVTESWTDGLDVRGKDLSVTIGVPLAHPSGWKARLAEADGGGYVMQDYFDYLLAAGLEEGKPGFGLVTVRTATMKVTLPGESSPVEADVFQVNDQGQWLYGIKKPMDPMNSYLQVDPVAGKFIAEDGTLTDDPAKAKYLEDYGKKQWVPLVVFARVIKDKDQFILQRDAAGNIVNIPIEDHPEQALYAYLDGAAVEGTEEIPVSISQIIISDGLGKETVLNASEFSADTEGNIVLPLNDYVDRGFFLGSVKVFYTVPSFASEKNFSFDTYLEWVIS